MRWLKKWGLPILTGGVVLAALFLPRQLSALADLRMFGVVHTEMLEEDTAPREATMPEKLELLARVIRYPSLEVYSTTQPLGEAEEGAVARTEEIFFQGVAYLMAWGVLPESIDIASLDFQEGSRAVYVQANDTLSVSMLYLQGSTDGRDDFWMVVDEETGLPVWIDCTIRSAKGDLPTAEELGRRFCSGLGLETEQRGTAVWEVIGAGGLAYSASVESDSGRISVEPLGFVWDLFGEDAVNHTAVSK